MLLDIGLPDLDGYALARRLRELPVTDRARAIAISGDAPSGVGDASRAIDPHLVEPVSLDAIRALLARRADEAAEPRSRPTTTRASGDSTLERA